MIQILMPFLHVFRYVVWVCVYATVHMFVNNIFSKALQKALISVYHLSPQVCGLANWYIHHMV